MNEENKNKIASLYGKNVKKNNRKKAIIYTRVSTKEQAENNTSLESQKRYCEEYAQKKGYEVTEYFGGTYESAKSDERKEFKKMIQYAKQNNSVGYILIYSFDRFSRTGANAAFISQELLKQGIKVISVTQDVDTSSPGGIFQQNLFFLFSQFDNEMRKDKTVTGMKELLKKGYWLWTPPRGYDNKKKHHRAVEWEIVINDEGEKLKKAFKWRASHKYKSSEIVRKLNLEGMKINEKCLSAIFKNPFYAGLLVSKMIPDEIIEGKHESIVSLEDFIAINSPEHKVKVKKYDSSDPNLPLKKLLRCPSCEHLMTGFLVKEKRLYYYNCQKKCKKVTISADKLHKKFALKLKNYQVDPEIKNFLAEVMEYKLAELSKEDVSETKRIKTALTKKQNELEGLEERFVTGKINEELFNKYSQIFKEEIFELNTKLDNPNISSSNLQKCIKKGLKISRNISDLWCSSDLSGRQKLQHLIYPEGIAYDKQKKRVQTFRTNTFFELISCYSEDLSENKSGDSIKKDQISALVTPSRFKLETSTAVM